MSLIPRSGTLALAILVGVSAVAEPATTPGSSYYDSEPTWDEATQGPLPRWREGGTPKDDPDQPTQPYSIDLTAFRAAPSSGLIASPPEYSPTRALLLGRQLPAGSRPDRIHHHADQPGQSGSRRCGYR